MLQEDTHTYTHTHIMRQSTCVPPGGVTGLSIGYLGAGCQCDSRAAGGICTGRDMPTEVSSEH